MRGVKEWISISVATIALVASIGGPYMAWGATQARLKEVENKVEKTETKNDLTIRHEALIPTMQTDIKDLKEMARESRQDIKNILSTVQSIKNNQ